VLVLVVPVEVELTHCVDAIDSVSEEGREENEGGLLPGRMVTGPD
jgi:hypothetical protein